MNKLKNLTIIALVVFGLTNFAYATSFTVGVEKSNAKPVALVDEDGASRNWLNPAISRSG